MPDTNETETARPPSGEASKSEQPEQPAPSGAEATSDEKPMWASSPELPADAPEDDSPPDLENRELCPDGGCVGVIGPDGRCGVCGKRAEPPAPRAPAEKAEAAPADEEPEASADDDLPPDFAARRLCSDGACIGVIGSDDRCKVCGKPYTGEPD